MTSTQFESFYKSRLESLIQINLVILFFILVCRRNGLGGES